MNLPAALSGIGLTTYESEVYLALLKLGRTTAGPIIRTTKLHRQHVYTALERLQERGLVSFVVQNNRRNFIGVTPDDLLKRETERFRGFASIIPALKDLQKKATTQLHVETLVGANEFFQSLISAADSAAKGDGLLRIFPSERGSDLYGFLGARYSEYVRHVHEIGVSKRVIVSPPAAEPYRERLLLEPRAQMRCHELGFSMPTYSLITNELIDFGIVSDDIVIVRIWSKALAKTYVDQFSRLWQLARPVRKIRSSKRR